MTLDPKIEEMAYEKALMAFNPIKQYMEDFRKIESGEIEEPPGVIIEPINIYEEHDDVPDSDEWLTSPIENSCALEMVRSIVL